MRLGRVCAAIVGAATGVAAAALAAGAFVATTSNPTSSFSAATLQPPTALSVTWTPNVNLSWSASTSSFASGYQVFRSLKVGGPFSQVGTATPGTATSYADTPGAGTFYYKLRSYLSGTTWVSTDTSVASRQDSTFVFKKTTGFTADGTTCNGTALRERDMQQGAVGADPEETFQRAGGVGTFNLCSDTFTAGASVAAGTTTVKAWINNVSGSTCQITATLYVNGTGTPLGSGSFTVPASSPLTLKTWSFATTAYTFAAGDRLNLWLSWQGVKACDSTDLHYGGTTYVSSVTVPSIDGYATEVAATSGLQSYWRLNETSGTTAADSAGAGSNTGTYANGVALGGAGNLGDAAPTATFDGIDDYVSVGDVFDFAGTASFTVETWIKPTTIDTTFRRIVAKELTDANGRQGWALWIYGGGATPYVGFDRFRDGLQDSMNTNGVFAPSAGQWYHVVFTFDGSAMKLYVNGSLVRTVTPATPKSVLDHTGPLRIGAYSGGGSAFAGSLHDVAIYNVALTQAQIQAHYDAR